MQPLRAKLYSQIAQQGPDSIDTLSRQYGLSKPVIQMQLRKMQEEGKQIKISDDEVSVLLDHNRPFWLYAGWVGIGFILYVLFGGLISG